MSKSNVHEEPGVVLSDLKLVGEVVLKICLEHITEIEIGSDEIIDEFFL